MDYEKKYKEALSRAKDCHVNKKFSELDDSAQQLCEYIFPELKESKDERTRKALIELVKQSAEILNKKNQESMLAWLEKQGEHAKFRNNIQIGDNVTRNQAGMLVNLSQLERVAKTKRKAR